MNKIPSHRAAVIGVAVIMSLAVAVERAASDPVPFYGGVAVFEAEDHTASITRNGRVWEPGVSPSGFSGTGFMVVTNGTDANSNINVNVTTSSPELQYSLDIPAGGSYLIWISAFAGSGTEDSVHAGFDGSPDPANPVTFPTYSTWAWSGGARTASVASAGLHTFSLWMREDGTRIDRVVVTDNPAFRPRIGNAWHIPHNIEPAIGFMRTPVHEIYPDTEVTVFSGNQFQGGTNAGNQITSASRLHYRASTAPDWTEIPVSFAAESGNNKYFSATIPAGTFPAGTVVEYYFKAAYDNFLPTYLAVSNGVRMETEFETAAQARPFSYRVLEPPGTGHPSPDDWQNENIYFLMTDRFYDGDPSNNDADPFSTYDPASGVRLHGGDLEGVEKKLDYIKALGATAIWITPIPWNTSERAYHGYSAYDFYSLAPQLGSTNTFQSMVDAAHARGIKVVLDIVANHQGRIIDSGDAGYPAYNPSGNYNLRWTDNAIQYPPPFNQLANFHAHGDIANYVDPDQIVGDLRGLDDLKTESQHVRTNFVEIYKHWIRTADLDGFRIDTVKHVEMGFWQHFCGEIRAFARQMGKTNFFSFGECFDPSDVTCASYTGTRAGGPPAMESVLDYPLYNVINSVFASASGNTGQIENRYDALAVNYDTDVRDRLVTFLDNHDNVRFLSSGRANNNLGRLRLALTFLYTSRGIPCLYYGTEQHFNGGHDPDNREDMFDGAFEQGPSLGDNFDMTKEGFLHVARLNNFRRLYPALAAGQHVNRWNNPTGPGLFAYARRRDTQELLIVLNSAGSTQILPDRDTIHAPGTIMVNLFDTNETITVTPSGNTPPITMPAMAAKIFTPRAAWLPLDPVVTNQHPAHGASDIPVMSPVTLRFSKPMDTNSMAEALVFDPPTAGMLEWSADRTAVTFTPDPLTPFAGETRYTVRIGTAAVDAADGLHLFAPFETFFDTAAAPDGDGDGIPDWWLQHYFDHPYGEPGDMSLAGQDADQDQVSNLEEYIAGSDPKDGTSFLRISSVGPASVGLWTAFGRRYDIESSPYYGSGWIMVASNQPGTGDTLEVPVTNAPPVQWYRAGVRLP